MAWATLDVLWILEGTGSACNYYSSFPVNLFEMNSSSNNKILTYKVYCQYQYKNRLPQKQLLYWSSIDCRSSIGFELALQAVIYSSTNKLFSVIWFKNSQCGDKIEKELLCIDFHFKCDKDFTVVFLGRLWSSEILSCLNKRIENNTSFRTSISVNIL